MRKRISFLVAGSATLLIPPTAALASVEDQGTGDAVVVLMSESTPEVTAGLDAWLSVPWRAENAEAREFRVVAVASDGVEVGYPENTVDHTSLHRDDTLSPAEVDFTAIRIRVDPKVKGPKVLNLTVSYVSDSGPHTEVVDLPVVVNESPFKGDGLAIADGALGEMKTTDVRWFSIDFKGLANTSNVELRVTDPGPFEIVYPAERDHSRPQGGTGVAKHFSDYAAIRFAADDVKDGRYSVTIEATYFVGINEMKTLVKCEIVVGHEDDGGGGDDDSNGDDGGDDDDDSNGDGGKVLYDSTVEIGNWITNPDGKDTATTGQWDVSVPEEASWKDHITQLGFTPSGSPGVITTGAAGSDSGENDVDGGRTSAISPAIHLPEGHSAKLSFSYYFAFLYNASKSDYLRISVVGKDGSKMLIEEVGSRTIQEAEWRQASFDLSDFAGQEVHVFVEAADESKISLVEAALADLKIELA